MRQLVATAAILSFMCAATAANAAIVPVLNASFEAPQTAVFSPGTITDWVLSDPSNQGVFRPSAFPASGGGFISGVDQFQTAYLNSGQISQVLSANLLSDTAYTLRVNVGDRADLPFPGYRVQLFAGSTLLAEDTSLVPNNGFLTSTVTFQTFGGPLVGQPLQIRLVSNGSQVNFDNVRLETAPAVPVPASLAIWGLGAIAVGLAYRRRKAAK